MAKVLLIGQGGREHALALALARSESVSHVLVAGIATPHPKVRPLKTRVVTVVIANGFSILCHIWWACWKYPFVVIAPIGLFLVHIPSTCFNGDQSVVPTVLSNFGLCM